MKMTLEQQTELKNLKNEAQYLQDRAKKYPEDLEYCVDRFLVIVEKIKNLIHSIKK